LPTDYVALARIEGLAGHTDPATTYLDLNERHLAAPKSAVQLAEWHAMFDAAIGLHATQGDIDAQFDLAAREAGSFIEPGPGAAGVNPNPAAPPTDPTKLPSGAPLHPGEDALRAADARAGRHWMLTPYQDLTIVHAVEKPLTSPVVSVDDIGVQRNPGETFAVLAGRIDNHAKSTGRLDLDAVWTQPVDDLAKEAP